MLQTNLQEIYHAVKCSGNRGLCLTANFSGTRIYDSTRGWGRLWRWFYDIIDKFTCKNYRLVKLKQAIIYTHAVFLDRLSLIEKNISTYKDYLKKLGSGYSATEESMHAVRNSIRSWNRATLPFVSLMRKCEHVKLNILFSMCFGEKNTPQNIWDCPSFAVAEKAGKLIDLEGVLQGPLPVGVFKKILRSKPLNSLDSKELNKWIKKNNLIPNCVEKLPDALRFIAECYSKDYVDATNDMIRLEVFLEDHGCAVFTQEDKEHIAWRSNLKTGETLSDQKHQKVLGSRIPSAKLEGDKTVVYHVRDFPEVVLIPQNRAVLGMRKFRQANWFDFGIEPAHFEICDDGRWAIMERLQPLDSHVWQSKSDQNKVHPEDAALLKVLCNMVSTCIKLNSTPLNFGAASLMFDQQSRLKVLPLHVEVTSDSAKVKPQFDFNALEDFIFVCASGNPVIFRHLIVSSGLYEHPIAKFYCELINNALKGDQTSIEDMASIYRIVDSKVVLRGTELLKTILTLRDQLCHQLCRNFPEKNIKTIISEANAQILQSHIATKACGRIFPAA